MKQVFFVPMKFGLCFEGGGGARKVEKPKFLQTPKRLTSNYSSVNGGTIDYNVSISTSNINFSYKLKTLMDQTACLFIFQYIYIKKRKFKVLLLHSCVRKITKLRELFF